VAGNEGHGRWSATEQGEWEAWNDATWS